MKNVLTLFACFTFLLCTLSNLNAQNEPIEFQKKDRFLIETGYNLVAGLFSGTGLSIVGDDNDDAVTSLGFDGGYFLSENFAFKFKLGLLSSGESLTNISLGGKYYIGGRFPIEVGAGTLSGGGESVFLGNFSLGYGIKLADNIYLEPNAGAIISDTNTLFEYGLNFSMFL